MDIVRATSEYEAWLAARTSLVAADLAVRHREMAAAPFTFLRGAFYRWCQVWPQLCPHLARAPSVLAVGDLHIENFGTWRDGEGRLIWGVNDFDEAYPLPYTNDLTRLATSANLARQSGHLKIALMEICDALLEGYGKCLDAGGRPFVLAEQHGWLRETALAALRPPDRFWPALEALPPAAEPVPDDVLATLQAQLPDPALPLRLSHRTAGIGSLGRQRVVAQAEWRGGLIAREAKALLPSAWTWAQGSSDATIHYQTILERAVRCPDPFVTMHGAWVLRRLAPDCTRIELESLRAPWNEDHLLRAMGWETANIHLGSPESVAALKDDLKKRPAGWLRDAASTMTAATLGDWQEWKKHAQRL